MNFDDTLAAIEETANMLESGRPRTEIIDNLISRDLTEVQAKQLILAVENTQRGAGRSRTRTDIEAKEPLNTFIFERHPEILT